MVCIAEVTHKSKYEITHFSPSHTQEQRSRSASNPGQLDPASPWEEKAASQVVAGSVSAIVSWKFYLEGEVLHPS